LTNPEPKSWRIGARTIAPASCDDDDARGLLWVWEEPSAHETYVVSIDPTVGRPGWSREFRTEADLDTDNAAIEIFRAGRAGAPDAQVAEYAAPVDAIDVAPIVAHIGLLYGSHNEDGQALIIGEVTGPGAVTLRELVDHWSYSNLWRWTQWGSAQVRRTQQFWWYSSRSANKDLWMRGSHHLHKRRCVLRSKWLIEELADIVGDVFLLIGEARYGRHDDRAMSTLMNLWAMHDWSTREDLEPLERPVEGNTPRWEATDISAAGMESEWDARLESLMGDE
jgi:hypothetical protein